jgi:hypothetical protein
LLSDEKVLQQAPFAGRAGRDRGELRCAGWGDEHRLLGEVPAFILCVDDGDGDDDDDDNNNGGKGY